MYKRAVGKAKRKFEESRRNELENMMRNPRRWWKMVRKLGMTGGRERSDIGKVYDEAGVVRQGKEAVEVWRKYFEKILNDGCRLGVQDEVESDKSSDEYELMRECLTREEVEQALSSLNYIQLHTEAPSQQAFQETECTLASHHMTLQTSHCVLPL